MRRALALATTPGRADRPQPAGRLRAPRRRRPHRGRGLAPRGRLAARRGRRPAPGRCGRPWRRPPSSPSSRATTPGAPVRARGRWSRPAYAAWSTPSATPTRSPPGERPPCAPRAWRSRAGCSRTRPAAVNREWTFAMDHGRPFVTWKFATTLDGRSAAADGTSRWVSSRAARVDTHRLRALCDTMLVGTNTVAVDDPLLTVRDDRGPAARRVQPLRAVMGLRDLPADRRVFDDAARDRPPAHPRPARGARRAVRARPPARLPRGRAHAGRGLLGGRARRRGRHLRRADAARRRPSRPSPTWASAPSPTRPT